MNPCCATRLLTVSDILEPSLNRAAAWITWCDRLWVHTKRLEMENRSYKRPVCPYGAGALRFARRPWRWTLCVFEMKPNKQILITFLMLVVVWGCLKGFDYLTKAATEYLTSPYAMLMQEAWKETGVTECLEKVKGYQTGIPISSEEEELRRNIDKLRYPIQIGLPIAFLLALYLLAVVIVKVGNRYRV